MSQGSIVTFHGFCMNLTLQEEDRRAVDLLLDGAATVGSGSENTVHYAVTDASLGERVARTQKLVQLLDALPEVEPPSDLVERTLRFVENPESRPHIATPAIHPGIGAQRPLI